MVRRIMFGTFWFVIFALAILVVGGGIAGATQGARTAEPGDNFREGFGHGYQAGAVAGAEFRQRYGWAVLVAAATLATAGSVAGLLPGTRR